MNRGDERGLSERCLIISPQAGLGNRLRAMAAAVVLARQTGRRLLHAWAPMAPDDGRPLVAPLQQRGYAGLFEASADLPEATKENVPIVDVCFSEWLPGDGWHPVQSCAQRRWEVVPFAQRYVNAADDIARCRAEAILLETSHAVRLSPALGGCPTDEAWERELTAAYRQFAPQRRYLDRVGLAPAADFGVSIRRGDFLQYFPEARQDLGELRRWVVGLAHGGSVALHSDDAAVAADFDAALRAAGERPVDCRGLGVGQLEAWESGFVVFLYLALRCAIVCGTPASSFAREAAIFGGRPYFPNLHAVDALRSALERHRPR
jgi:hypothetical protein